MESKETTALNILGGRLEPCCLNPLTGYFRNGNCDTDQSDYGNHSVCCVVTQAFLLYSKQQGNDLTTPRPEFNFKGLRPGDKWCLCAARWLEAYNGGFAPFVVLEATHQRALAVIPKELLVEFQLQKD